MKTLFTLVCAVLFYCTAFSQADTIPPPYKRFPTYPPVKLLLPDSSSYYTKDNLPKNKPVLLMVFSSDCSHCQHETEEIIANINALKDIQIVMATFLPFDSMMVFRQRYQLDRFSNIVTGRDFQYFLPSFFNITHLPFLAFYNRKKELVDVFRGSLPIKKLVELIRK